MDSPGTGEQRAERCEYILWRPPKDYLAKYLAWVNEVSRMLENHLQRTQVEQLLHTRHMRYGRSDERTTLPPTERLLKWSCAPGGSSASCPGRFPVSPGQDVDQRFRNLVCRGPLSQIGPELGFDWPNGVRRAPLEDTAPELHVRIPDVACNAYKARLVSSDMRSQAGDRCPMEDE